MRFVEIKELNAFVHNRPFFDHPVRKKQVHEKFIEMSTNDDYKTKKILDF